MEIGLSLGRENQCLENTGYKIFNMCLMMMILGHFNLVSGEKVGSNGENSPGDPRIVSGDYNTHNLHLLQYSKKLARIFSPNFSKSLLPKNVH